MSCELSGLWQCRSKPRPTFLSQINAKPSIPDLPAKGYCPFWTLTQLRCKPAASNRGDNYSISVDGDDGFVGYHGACFLSQQWYGQNADCHLGAAEANFSSFRACPNLATIAQIVPCYQWVRGKFEMHRSVAGRRRRLICSTTGALG